ncbi:intestinal mucin-like protein [Dendropsophus ebraccatus]|uniref:intestinal mucin-like protein n=1 Tax=Dendropsophus ebraccatus TaxID=150705 RepID=UPI00383161D5
MCLQIGQAILVKGSSCKTCKCSGVKDPKTGFNAVVCEHIRCIVQCPLGYVYKTSNNSCCGTCIQDSCIVVATDGSSYFLKPGESQFPLNDNCTQYTCIQKGNTLVTSSLTKVCPTTEAEECTSGLLEKTPDGCCKICKAPKACRVKTNVTEISRNGCSANVTVSYCDGWCPSPKKFSETSLQMEGKCECCIATETSNINVDLVCPGDNNNIRITMSSATKCECFAATCTP